MFADAYRIIAGGELRNIYNGVVRITAFAYCQRAVQSINIYRGPSCQILTFDVQFTAGRGKVNTHRLLRGFNRLDSAMFVIYSNRYGLYLGLSSDIY